MKIKIGIAAILFFAINVSLFAQEDDLSTNIEYTYFHKTDSDNSFRRFRARINIPLKLSERAYLLPGYEYRNVELQYGDSAPFSTRNLDRFQSHTLRLTYTFGLPKDWRFAGRVGAIMASNFERSDIIHEDVVFEGIIAVLKDRGPDEVDLPWRLVFGIHYSTKSGRPFPLPVINYFKTVNQNWAYTVGVPESNLIYMFNKKNHVRLFAELDGFYANIQEGIPFMTNNGNTRVAEDISMTVVLGGLRYDYYFTKHLLAFAYGGW